MLARKVGKKYAQGLFLSVSAKGLIDQAHDQLRALDTVARADPRLMKFLMAPHVLEKHKLTLVSEVFADRLDLPLLEFLLVLVRKHRIGFLHEIIDEFIRLVEATKGIARATVITAVPIRDNERSRLSQKLAARTGMRVLLDEKVDPAVVGGMIVILHNEIIDGSIRHGLELIGDRLSKVRVH